MAAASTPDGELLMVYVPEAVEITIDLSKLAGEEVTLWRVDATNGAAALDAADPTTGPALFSSSGVEVLIFRNAAQSPALGAWGAGLLALLVGFAGMRLRRR